MSEPRPSRRSLLGRRAFLRTLALGSAGLLAACQASPAAPSSDSAAAGSAAAAGLDAGAQQTQWDALVAAARQEGQLSLHGPPTPDTRQMVPEAFTRRFGIPVEYNALRSNEIAVKMVTEKQAGLITIDAMLTGLTSYADILYPNGLLADLRAALILPEVTDPTVWILEPTDLFLDPEHTRLMRLFYTTTAAAAVNRDYVDPTRVKVAADLLRPELKGKISAEDPTVPGSGANVAAHFYLRLGEEFVRTLYGEQAVVTRDNRQRADWLVRGTQPVTLSLSAAELDKVLQDGFPVEVIRKLDDLPGLTGSAFGVAALVEGAPHPNAAKLFVNWIASREGLEVFSRAERVAGTRKDLDYAQWVPAYSIPLPGVSYVDTYNWDWKAREQPAAAEKLKEILAGR
ncbi:MAG TPA: substrate-binding domain-containing protein [Chloroflexota bacterium]|nr:substrate-binding domain-containing protein [Chloroflexota bacterium]